VIANHFDFMPLTYSRLVSTPMVTTIHGFSSPEIVAVYRAYDDIAHYVAISDSNRHPDLHYAATIHHGIDLSRFTFVPVPGDYLLFLGRIHPDKGAHLALEVARRSGIPLVIAGIVQDEAYYRDAVAPHIDGVNVSYVGPVGPEERDALLGGAQALLHLISFAEPFGLSKVTDQILFDMREWQARPLDPVYPVSSSHLTTFSTRMSRNPYSRCVPEPVAPRTEGSTKPVRAQ
jgi:glycosyltransferase involved in cell wall biosynthesis